MSKIISTAGKIPWAGNALRWCASQYEENSVVQIQHGQAAGLFWQRHHRYVNGYWIGHYELPVQEALQRELKPGHTFFDIGAHAGFFTLIGARLVGEAGRCIAFEPLEENCSSIEEQIEANEFRQCLVVREAISDFRGSEIFSYASTRLSTSHLGRSRPDEQDEWVKVMTVDEACFRYGKPDFIKMDIEGAEARALQGASRTLRDHRPTWLIELHSPQLEQAVGQILRTAGYTFADLLGLPLDPAEGLPNHFIATFPRSSR